MLVDVDFRRIECYIDTLINSDGTPSILNKTALKALCQLYNTLNNVSRYDNKKGFSKKPRWIDFVDLVNKVNNLLKDAVKRYQANN